MRWCLDQTLVSVPLHPLRVGEAAQQFARATELEDKRVPFGVSPMFLFLLGAGDLSAAYTVSS